MKYSSVLLHSPYAPTDESGIERVGLVRPAPNANRNLASKRADGNRNFALRERMFGEFHNQAARRAARLGSGFTIATQVFAFGE
jgi:hypothetical protein